MFASQKVFHSGFHNLWWLSDCSVEGDPPAGASRTPFAKEKTKKVILKFLESGAVFSSFSSPELNTDLAQSQKHYGVI